MRIPTIELPLGGTRSGQRTGCFLFSLLLVLLISLPVAAAFPPGGTIAPMLEKVLPAVVAVSTHTLQPQRGFRRFSDAPARRRQGLGSGVIIDARKGLVLTNSHVIDKADSITVTLHDKRRFEATVVGTDPEADIALLKIEAKGLTAVKLMKDSEQLRVGDFVVAIGNPFGLGQTVTSGIISALGRSGLGIEGYEDFIQTDASINPGNSGGALVTLNGELAGMNTAIVGPSGGNVGIGFAIPANMIRAIVTQLEQHGEVRRGQLGVVIQDISPRLKEAFGLPGIQGAVVTRVLEGSPARRAGLKTGDVILAVNGKTVDNSSDLRNTIGFLPVGERIRLTVLRDGRKRTLKATIAATTAKADSGEVLGDKLSGVILGPIAPDHPLYQRVDGIQVLAIERGSLAARAGLRPGDVITSINRRPVASKADVIEILNRPSDALLLHILRGNNALFMVID
ncbi:MAG TPA: Do family serine endopeptidase [Sedimenticola sp.]|nr:Do family serine endopeptidase [Sedimenticola sp.]